MACNPINEYIRTQHNWFKNKNANPDDFNGDIIAGIIQIPDEPVCMPCYVKNGNSCVFDNSCTQEPASIPVTLDITVSQSASGKSPNPDKAKEYEDPCENHTDAINKPPAIREATDQLQNQVTSGSVITIQVPNDYINIPITIEYEGHSCTTNSLGSCSINIEDIFDANKLIAKTTASNIKFDFNIIK